MGKQLKAEDYLSLSIRDVWKAPPPTAEVLLQMPPSIPFAVAALALGWRREAAHIAARTGRFGFGDQLVPISRLGPRKHRCLLRDVLSALGVEDAAASATAPEVRSA